MSAEERAKVEAMARRETHYLPYICSLELPQSRHGAFQHISGPCDLLGTVRNIPKGDLLQRVTASVQTINAIANGLRPDLFQIIADWMQLKTLQLRA
jgi:hypothetical protein